MATDGRKMCMAMHGCPFVFSINVALAVVATRHAPILPGGTSRTCNVHSTTTWHTHKRIFYKDWCSQTHPIQTSLHLLNSASIQIKYYLVSIVHEPGWYKMTRVTVFLCLLIQSQLYEIE